MSFVRQLVVGCLAVGTLAWSVQPRLASLWRVSATPAADVRAIERSVYYPGCNEARAAGVAPIYRGSPGYREEMDGDGDGIACEPHRLQ